MLSANRLFLALLLFVVAHIQPSHAMTLRVGEAVVEFDPGQGMCALNRDRSDFDRSLLDWQQRANAGKNEVIGIFVDCRTLTRLRNGENIVIGQYGILLAPHGNRPLAPLSGVTRERFIAEMIKAINKGTPLDEKEIGDRINNSMDKELKEAVGDLKVSGFRQLGVLARDESAVYSGLLMNTQVGNATETIAAVLALTIVKNYPLQYSLYRPFVDKTSFQILLEGLKPLMRNLVLKNELAENRLRDLPQVSPSAVMPVTYTPSSQANSGGIDWGKVVEKGIVGAVVGGLFACILFLWKGIGAIFRRFRADRQDN